MMSRAYIQPPHQQPISAMNGSKWLLSLCWSAFACQALTTEEWQKQSIYSLMTDRFATSGDEHTPCSLMEKAYCGGTWQGIVDRLDYIQGMGFTAVSEVLRHRRRM